MRCCQSQIFRIIFYVKENKLFRFSSLEDCYETYDDLRTNTCSAPKIEEEDNAHICASSQAGDICNGDSGSGLVIVDKQFK